MTERSPGQVAYEAWAEAHNWPSGFPAWDAFPPNIQAKWQFVAGAVLKDTEGQESGDRG